MGMGEPLLNVGNVCVALDLLSREVSPRRTTLSTAGVVPGIEVLSGRPRRPNLAVSLCAADDATRSRLMPVNRTYPLADLFAALKNWPLEKGRRITFEWVLIAGVNDTPEMARRLAALVKQLPSKVNLIPLNESPKWLPDLKRPSPATVDAFARALARAGIDVTVRWSKGLQADAACGQLWGARRAKAPRLTDLLLTTNDAARSPSRSGPPLSRRGGRRGRGRGATPCKGRRRVSGRGKLRGARERPC